ncbi:LicD family protein [Nostoc sp. ChiVER01]|uniref:LicD family protein n=1 Tax=Nostoc sp. ChiVER01 TaxID=3075382 RepID=UPI002AD515CE|nr:LicD family protein [Nostoc sp. ChiVER01]MDZ8221845.1 LicD family protein [Nostoc sp. ChiVER01]
MDNTEATLNLIEAKEILDTLGIHFWLTDGTLLGYYRENDFIKHDKDIDIALFAKDYTEKIAESFAIQGFKVKTRGTQAEGLLLSVYKNGINLDLFFAYEEKDYIWYACWAKTHELIENSNELKYELVKFAYPKTKFKKIIFKENEFNIPDDVEKYLSWVYGNFWKISEPDWDWTSPKNIIDAPWLQLPEISLKRNLKIISHLYIQVLYSLIEQYKRNPLDPDILSALQKARKQNADFWMSIPPEEIKTTYSGLMKKSHQILRESRIQNGTTARSELNIIFKMLNQAQERKLEQSQYLLAALLYIRPGQLQL